MPSANQLANAPPLVPLNQLRTQPGASGKLTVKGSPMTSTQSSNAQTLLSSGQAQNAPEVALVAIIYAGMGESSLGADSNTYQNNGVGYWGVLQGSVSTWPNPHDTQGMAQSFFGGGKGFQAGGANHLAAQGVTNPAEIAIRVEVPSIWPSDAYAAEWHGGSAEGVREAQAIVHAFAGGALPGGTAGLGGTGLPANDLSNAVFAVGDVGNPTEDYWTAINRLGQARQWYVFSDGETLYLADGPDLMAQNAAASVDRVRDVARIVHLDFTWDNVAFQYVASHKKKKKLQRRTGLAKVVSPVEGTLDLICAIDAIRAGDVITMSGCGPGDGKWLVGECRRSVFSVYSEITLVPALAPLTEQEVAGSKHQASGGPAASLPSSGTVMAAMISAAAHINNQNLPYVWGGGHAHVGTPDGGTGGGPRSGSGAGFDCSGAVAAVLRAGGLWKPSSVGNDQDVIRTLQSAKVLASGQGTGDPECSLFDEPGVHIFMRLNGQYWGTSAGARPKSAGGGWVPNGSVPSGFTPYHIPQAVLTTGATTTPGS